jgi:hypothetical protein
LYNREELSAKLGGNRRITITAQMCKNPAVNRLFENLCYQILLNDHSIYGNRRITAQGGKNPTAKAKGRFFSEGGSWDIEEK